jgi:hypothetical protein
VTKATTSVKQPGRAKSAFALLAHTDSEPARLTNDADIRTAKSIVDYIFRWMGKKFLSPRSRRSSGS